MIEWTTQSETNTLGYQVLRNSDDDVYNALYATDELINAAGGAQEITYQWEDIDVEMNNTYYYWLETYDTDGTSELFGPVFCSISPGSGGDDPVYFEKTGLAQNRPNPFYTQNSAQTTIFYSLRGTQGVPVQAELAIYNIRGQRVRTLLDGMQEPGQDLSVVWHGDDDSGRAVASGIYFYKLTAPGFTEMRKMMILK